MARHHKQHEGLLATYVLKSQVKPLGEDALLAEVDDRLFEWGESEEVDHILYGMSPVHPPRVPS